MALMGTPESIQISFNYFYQEFQDKYRQEILKIKQTRISQAEDELDDIFPLFMTEPISKTEMLVTYNKILYDICIDYVTLSDASINVFPKDTLEFVDLILDTIYENPYKESFLISLQFIYQNYFDCLEKGCPVLMSSEDPNSPSSLEITLDSHYQITQFDATNMDLVEQDKIMTKILSMEINKQIGPIPKVLYHIRKDI